MAQFRIAAVTDHQQSVQVATVMAHASTAYRDQAFRAYVREWTLAPRTYDDLGRHMAHDTSAPMDIGQVKGFKCKGGRERQGQERGW